MNENLKNQSELLYTQAKQQFDAIKLAYESGDLTTEVAVIQAAFDAFQEFFSTLGEQRFEAIRFDESTPMWTSDYNGMMQDIYDDFEVLFREATLLADAMYVDFNHHVVQHDILSEKLKGIQNKLYDLAAYNSVEGYTTNVFAKEEFLNQDRIDYDKITMSPLTIEGGNVTLPQKSKVSALDDATAMILLGSRPNTLAPVGALSNGYPGNSHEIVTSTKDFDTTGKSLSLNFVGASNNRSNYGAVLDNNPNTWFEFEKVVPTQLVNSVSEKDYGFSYKTAYDNYHYWTDELADGVLKLCLEINLNDVKTINAIDVAMYTPANRLAKTAKIAKILVVDENNNSQNVSYTHTGTFYKFNAINARAVQLFFEQDSSYTTEIGHIFYTKKYLSEDANGYKQSVVNRIAEANNRIDGPIPWITEIGAVIEEDTTRSEVFYAPFTKESPNLSVNDTLSNLKAQIGIEDVEMGVERIQAERYCIGIKDIQIYEAEFEEEGELITKPFYFENPLERISLNISEADGFNANWLNYDISIDDGITWYPIIPLHRQEAGTKTYIIQQVERGSGIIQKEGIIETDTPIYSMRIRIIGRAGEIQQQSRAIVVAAQSPVLNTLEIQGVTRSTDDVLTYVSEEEETFFQYTEPPVPPIEIIPTPIPTDCVVCDEPGNTGQEPDDPENEDPFDPESDPVSKITSILKSDKYRVCLDDLELSRRQVKVTYGAKSTLGYPITEFKVEFDKFPHLNEHMLLEESEYIQKISKDVIIDLSLLEDGDELIVTTYGRNTDGFEIYDEISIEILGDCSLEWDPTEPEGKSDIRIDPRLTMGRFCEHTFLETGDVSFVAYTRSRQPIVGYEIYEAESVVESKIFSPEDNIFELTIPHVVNKDLYSLEEKTKSPYIIVYDAKGKKKKKTFRLTLKDCLGKGKKEYLYAEFKTEATEFCVDEKFIYKWKVGSSAKLRQVRIWFGEREIHNKVYALTSKTTRASGSVKIPYNQLEIGNETLRIEMTDANGQVLNDTRYLTFVGDCSEDDERRVNKINVTARVQKSEYCPCGEDIVISGSIKAKPGLERVIFKLNNMTFEPSQLNALGRMDESICTGGYPGYSDEVSISSVDLSQMSAIERVEYMADNGMLNTNITDEDLAFMQGIEEYEIDESCGCRKKKGTKQALEALGGVSIMNTTPANFIEDISPVITKITEERYSYEFTLPYWFIYESGFTAIGRTYNLVVEGINTEGKSDKATAKIKIATCNEPVDPNQPDDPDNPDEPKDPEKEEEDCQGDVIQAIHMTYYNVLTEEFKTKRFSMLKGQSTANARTLIDGSKNKVRVGTNLKDQRIWVQKLSKGEYPGFMIAQMYVEVGPKNLSSTRRYEFTSGDAFGETESLENLIASKGEIDFDTHYLYNDLRELGDASTLPKLIETNSYFELFISDLPWDDLCPQSHLTHKPKDLKAEMDDEDIEDINCEDHKSIHIQYYDDVEKKLRDVFFNLVDGVGETRIIQARNGSQTKLEVLAGYSGNSKGPAISIANSSEEDDRYLFISAIGVGYTQATGGLDYIYADSIFFSTRDHEGLRHMLGEPKQLEELTWIQNGIVNVDDAPWVGGHRDMVSTKIKLPANPCNQNDDTFDKLFPIPSEEIINREQLERNGVIKFESFVTPVFNNNIAPGEVEVVKGRFRVRRTWKSFREVKFFVRYTFANTNTVVQEHPVVKYDGSQYAVTGRMSLILEVAFEFMNMDHYGYGKVTKAEIFVSLGRETPVVFTQYPNYSIEIPVEKGNRNETMRMSMVASTASEFLDGICVNKKVSSTYTFDVAYRLFDTDKEITQFGIQIRSSREIIGEAYRTYSNVRNVNDSFPVLVERTDIKQMTEAYYYAVPMVQFKGTSVMVPLANYQLELRTLRCI